MNDTNNFLAAEAASAAQVFDFSSCTLVALDSGEKAKSESHHMKHAMFLMWKNKMFNDGDTLWSMRDAKGTRVLSMLVQDDKVCYFVVGMANRKPTNEELKLLEPLLAAQGMTLKYSGPYMGKGTPHA